MNDFLLIDYLAHPDVDEKLKRFYGIATEKELLHELGSDFYYLSSRDISQNESCLPFYVGPMLDMQQSERRCPFGIRWRRGAYRSKFAVDEAIEGPLQKAQSEKDILAYSWPKLEWFDFSAFGQEIAENEDRVIVGGFWSGILGDSFRIHGFENFLLNIAIKPVMIKTLINKMTDFYVKLNSCFFKQFGNKIDIWFFGNDLGSQTGLLLSPQMLNDFFMDNFKRLCDLAHSYNIKVMMHSCGAISEIISMLIDVGVDILDPVQVTAKGMEPMGLKKQFRDRIVFHGGIDTQCILPNGTIEQVKQHCLKTIEIFGQDGGYIFAPSQILGPDIPVENIDMMYKVAKNCNKVKREKEFHSNAF